MKNLKFLVIFMAVLLVLGISFLIFAIATGMHKTGSVAKPSFTEYTVTLTDDQMLLNYAVDQGRLLLHIMDITDNSTSWQVIDYLTGEDIGKINIKKPNLTYNTTTERHELVPEF